MTLNSAYQISIKERIWTVMPESTENVVVQGEIHKLSLQKDWILNPGISELYYKLEIVLIPI